MGSILRGSPGGGKSTCSAAGPPTSPTFWARLFWPVAGAAFRAGPRRDLPHTAVSPWPATLRGTTVRRLERGRATSPAIVHWAGQRVPRRAPQSCCQVPSPSALTPPMHNAEAPAAAVTLLACCSSRSRPRHQPELAGGSLYRQRSAVAAAAVTCTRGGLDAEWSSPALCPSRRGPSCSCRLKSPSYHPSSLLSPCVLASFFFFFPFFRFFDKPCGVSEHSSSALAGLVAQLLVQG